MKSIVYNKVRNFKWKQGGKLRKQPRFIAETLAVNLWHFANVNGGCFVINQIVKSGKILKL